MDTDHREKWTEIEHLPEWDEEFYDIYTARKHGKWVMIKALKENLRTDPRAKAMMEKEFDVRYNLAHPNIVMINDFEEVPGLGLCIITDDVYGKSLASLIAENKVTSNHIEQIRTRLLDAIDYIQRNHVVHFPITPESIIFTENIGNLKLINVGFDQHSHLTPAEASSDIEAFGNVLGKALDACDDYADLPHLRRIVDRCSGPSAFRSVHALNLALEKHTDKRFYIAIIILLILTVVILLWLISGHGPRPLASAVFPDIASDAILSMVRRMMLPPA